MDYSPTSLDIDAELTFVPVDGATRVSGIDGFAGRGDAVGRLPQSPVSEVIKFRSRRLKAGVGAARPIRIKRSG